MKQVLINMDLAEIGIAILGIIIGIVAGYVLAVVRHWSRDRKFIAEEREIKRQISKMPISKIIDLSANGQLTIDPAIKVIFEKAAIQLSKIKVDPDNPENTEEQIEVAVSLMQQLAYR